MCKQLLIAASILSLPTPIKVNKEDESSSKAHSSSCPLVIRPLSDVSFLSFAAIGTSYGVSDVVSICTVLRRTLPCISGLIASPIVTNGYSSSAAVSSYSKSGVSLIYSMKRSYVPSYFNTQSVKSSLVSVPGKSSWNFVTIRTREQYGAISFAILRAPIRPASSLS